MTRTRSATRERLLDASRVVLAREGIQGASVEHICEQAGYTRGAFYSNFSSKDDLLLAVFRRERDAMIARLREAGDLSGLDDLGVAEAMAVIIDRFAVLQPADRDWYLAHAEFELRGVRDDAVGREFNEAWTLVKQQVETMIEQVLAAMGLRLTIEVAHAATVLVATYDAAVREALIERRGLDLSLLRDTVPRLMLSVAEPVIGPVIGSVDPPEASG